MVDLDFPLWIPMLILGVGVGVLGWGGLDAASESALSIQR